MPSEQGIFAVWKRLGETPLEALQRVRALHPEISMLPMTYAGRLDPLAEGVLIALFGEARYRKSEFLALDKEYLFDALWGFETDSGDVLGIAREKPASSENIKKIGQILPECAGRIEQEYPAYSSKPVKGKPLFMWAREGRLGEIEIPKRSVEIFSLDHLGTRAISREALEALVKERISLVRGDFRQEEALRSWESALKASGKSEFAVSSFRAAVSSGTYIRSLIGLIGDKIGTGGTAVRIVRTSVGGFELPEKP